MTPKIVDLRAAARVQAWIFGALVTVTDLLPPRIRYGYVHGYTRRVLQRPLPELGAAFADDSVVADLMSETEERSPEYTLVAGSLDVGGIGAVVETLARTLPAAGVRASVLCADDGERASRLRNAGIQVLVARSQREAEAALRRLAPSAVELHAAPEQIERAVVTAGIPTVPVLHNTEIHYSRAQWARLAGILAGSRKAIAVSETVRGFHAKHVGEKLADCIVTVPNAVPERRPPTAEQRQRARAALERTIGTSLRGQIVFVSLVRYDAQKNVAGLVASFLAEVSDKDTHLVIAGEPSDWAEFRRADALRRRGRGSERVSLLARSDSHTLLAAADAFVLDSFFEGWPVAATEAAAAGLPLVLADVGGARELVSRDPERSILMANACGEPSEVSDAAVARARRRSASQSNRAELGAAIVSVSTMLRHAKVRGSNENAWPKTSSARRMEEMVGTHAAILRDASSNGAKAGSRELGGGE